MRFLAIVHRFVIEMNFHSTPQGAVSQLLDSLDEIQMLSGGNAKDTSFLQTFLEDHTFQCLLEVSSSRLHLCASSPVLTWFTTLVTSSWVTWYKFISGMIDCESFSTRHSLLHSLSQIQHWTSGEEGLKKIEVGKNGWKKKRVGTFDRDCSHARAQYGVILALEALTEFAKRLVLVEQLVVCFHYPGWGHWATAWSACAI